jgi:conjugative transfer protein TraD
MSYEQKLKELEQQKKRLVEKRLQEIASLVEKTGTLKLDNDIIMGALFSAKKAFENEDNSKLEELRKTVPERFRKQAKSRKPKPKPKLKQPSKTQQNSKTA